MDVPSGVTHVGDDQTDVPSINVASRVEGVLAFCSEQQGRLATAGEAKVSSTETQCASAVELNTQTGSLLIEKKNGGVLSLLDPPLLLLRELIRSSVTLDTTEHIAVEGRSMKARCASLRARCQAQPPNGNADNRFLLSVCSVRHPVACTIEWPTHTKNWASHPARAGWCWVEVLAVVCGSIR